MVIIELKWLIIFVGLVTIILGFLLLILKKSSEYVKGPLLWATACFVMGIGLILFSSIPIPNETLTIIFSPFLIVISRSFYLAGIWQFKGKKINYPLILSLPLLSGIQSAFFCLVISDPSVRIAINSSIFAFMAFYLFYEMITPTEKSLKKICTVNAIVFLLNGILMVFRALFAFRIEHPDMLKSGSVSFVFFALTVVLQGILTYGLIIMVNTKVADDLKKQIAIKDMFFSIIAHDLNNQVNVIKGFGELLYTNISKNNSEKSLQFAGYIRQASLQTNALLTNLLDWAKIQNKINIFNPEKLNLDELIWQEIEACESMASNKQITVDFKEELKEPIWADKNMFKTILRNLLINAIKFTNQGGRVKIQTKIIPQYIEISVTDSGIGIEPDTLKRLFNYEALVSTEGTFKEKGTGLGLMLCKEFVEKHDGKIWIESQFEIGSSVKFIIPFKPK
jgi:two-component system, sensor histidine kinase and response regulator